MVTDAQEAKTLLGEVLDEAPDVYLLALTCSLATRIDSLLLRTIRRDLGPVLRRWRSPPPERHAAPRLSAASEGRLWHSALIAARGPSGCSLDPAVALELRRRLRTERLWCRPATHGQGFEPADEDAPGALPLIEAVWHLTQARHAILSPAMQWEERLSWQLASRDYDRLDALFAEPLAVLLGDPDDPEAPRSTAGWLYGALHRMPPVLWSSPTAWAVGVLSATLASREGGEPRRLPRPAPDLLPETLRCYTPAYVPGARAVDFSDVVPSQRTEIGVRRQGTLLTLCSPARAGELRLDVPATRPRILEVEPGSPDAARRVVLVPDDGREVTVDVGTEDVALWAVDGRRWSLDREPPVREEIPPHEHALPQVELVGRASDQDWLEQWWSSDAPIGAVLGESGSGRSSLLGWFRPQVTTQTFVWRYDIDPDLLRSLSYLAHALGRSGYWELDEAVRGQTDRLLIVLDGVSAEQMSRPELRRLIETVRGHRPARLLLTGPATLSESLDDAATLELSPLDPTEAMTLLRRRGARQTDDVLLADLAEMAEGRALTLALMGDWLATDPDPASLGSVRALLDGRDAVGRVRWLVRRLLEALTTGAIDSLGDVAAHVVVQHALAATYDTPLDAPAGHVLEPLAKLADEDEDPLLRASILRFAGEPKAGQILGPETMALFEALGIWRPEATTERNWWFWRSCGIAIGRLLGQPGLGEDERRAIVETLRQHRSADVWRHQQTTAIALSKSGLLEDEGDELAYGLLFDLWRQGLPQPEADGEPRRVHPQLTWTIVKDLAHAKWARTLLDDIARLEDWARERLVLSLVQFTDAEKAELGLLDRDHPLVAWLVQRRQRLLGLLSWWAEQDPRRHPSTVFDLPADDVAAGAWRRQLGLPAESLLDTQDSYRRPPMADKAARDAVCRSVSTAFVDGALSAAELVAWFDLASLAIEITPTSGHSEGRYNLFEHITGAALTAAGARAHAVALALADCYDEGVRWGVAQRLGTRYGSATKGRDIRNLRELVEPEHYWQVVRRLARDDNEWVPRDTLKGVRQVWEARATSGWGALDDAEAARLADAVVRWIDERRRYTDAYLIDVQDQIERLQIACPAFGERWWALRGGEAE